MVIKIIFHEVAAVNRRSFTFCCDNTTTYSLPTKNDFSKSRLAKPLPSTYMNYEGAKGLEFGDGNTAIDPSVAAGQLQC